MHSCSGPLCRAQHATLPPCSNAVRGAGDAEHDVLPGTLPAGGPPQPGGGPNGALPPPPQLSADDAKRLRKAQKRAAKEARRAVKKVLTLYPNPVASLSLMSLFEALDSSKCRPVQHHAGLF